MFKMTPNVLKNLITKKATRRYPKEVRTLFADARGQLVNDIEKCKFCKTCAVKCPSQCITVDRNSATWSCDPFVCVYCGVCVEACPENSLYQRPEYRSPVSEHNVILLKGEPPKRKSEKKDQA